MHIGLNAHLLSARPGYRTAGIHQYIDHLLRMLPAVAPEDWRITAMVGAAQHAQYDGLSMRRAKLDTEAALSRVLWEQCLQPWALARFDLYHALAFVAPVIQLAPMVVTIYDLSFIHYPQRLPGARRAYLEHMTRLTCRRAERVMAISHSVAYDVAQTLGIAMAKIDIAPPGCDFERFKPLPQAVVAAFRHQQDLPPRFWLFVGTLEPRKNLILLLEAYAALRPHERLPLVLAGGKGWDYEPIFQTADRLGLRELVTFPGFISPESLPLWYNAAEAFLYPSVFEGFGIPVLEAMACGTPVVVSDATSLPEVAGNAGMCVPAHDAGAWTEALRQTALDDTWRAGARSRGMVYAQRYSWKATAEAVVTCYRLALGD